MIEKQIKSLESKINHIESSVNKLLLIMTDDPAIGHEGLGSRIKKIGEDARENSELIKENAEKIKQIEIKTKQSNYFNIAKGAVVGGGAVGGGVKLGPAVKELLSSFFS